MKINRFLMEEMQEANIAPPPITEGLSEGWSIQEPEYHNYRFGRTFIKKNGIFVSYVTRASGKWTICEDCIPEIKDAVEDVLRKKNAFDKKMREELEQNAKNERLRIKAETRDAAIKAVYGDSGPSPKTFESYGTPDLQISAVIFLSVAFVALLLFVAF